MKKRTHNIFIKIILLLALGVPAGIPLLAQKNVQDSFPVPPATAKSLFYLQRTSNKNTIVCDLNLANGLLVKDDPVHVYWLRYAEKGQAQELSYIQRTFAYGLKINNLANDAGYEMHFVSYKKQTLYLMKGSDGKYHVYTIVNGRRIVLNRIFIKINGGSFWSPNVEYVEFKGTDAASGKEIIDRLKI